VSILRAAAAWACTGIYWSAFALLQALALGKLPDRFVQGAMRTWSALIQALSGVRYVFENESTLETREGRVVVFNHQSALDMIFAAAIAPPGMLALGKAEIIFVPFVNLAWWALGFLRVDRKNPRRLIEEMSQIAAVVARDKRSLLLSPEGTRTRDGAFMPFKRGAFQLAIQAQVPVYPLVMWGAFELMPRTASFPKPGVVRVRYLPPVETRGLDPKDAAALGERIKAEMERVYREGLK
jgi:1-acyl-sn-glycerol-3-phosphate acyltransferase